MVYVEDHGEPGNDVDRFWIEVKDGNGNVVLTLRLPPPDEDAVASAVTLGGGNIVVPHEKQKGKP